MTAISVTLNLMLMFLSHFLPTGGPFGIFFEQLTVCKSCRPGNLTPSLFKCCETSIPSPLCTFLTNVQLSMSRLFLGIQSIFISPKMAGQIFPEPAFFSSKLGTRPPYTVWDPERKEESFRILC